MKRANIKWSGLGLGMVLALTTSTGWAMQEGAAKETKVKAAHLPAAVAEAIRRNCPNCVIDKATREVENGVKIYDIEFKPGQGEIDVAEDGSVIDRETVVETKDIPEAALEAIRKGAAGGKIKQVAKSEIRAELKEGKIIKLDSPKYLYEADLVKGNQAVEIVVDPNGQVIEAPEWKPKGLRRTEQPASPNRRRSGPGGRTAGPESFNGTPASRQSREGRTITYRVGGNFFAAAGQGLTSVVFLPGVQPTE